MHGSMLQIKTHVVAQMNIRFDFLNATDANKTKMAHKRAQIR